MGSITTAGEKSLHLTSREKFDIFVDLLINTRVGEVQLVLDFFFLTVFNCASGLLMRAITVYSEATLLKSS